MIVSPRKLLPLLLALLVTSLIPASRAQEQQPNEHPALYLGAAWYPEQWPESRWDADLTLMEQAHIRFVRVGEFAWSTMEPTEGNYQWEWLDRAIADAARHHIYVVLGTPTAAPPAWLTTKYPETLRIMEDGRRDQHGNRQQFDWANPKYRELARDIAERMAKRYGHNPNVIGWQIDNEYAAESYGPEDQKQFDEWCHEHYKTLDNLNTRWTTAYWSQTYTDWSQIPIEERYGNPGLLLSWKRFVSDTWRSYQKNQLDVIRANSDPRQFITTNMMGWFDGYDHYTVSQDLSLASWDDYVGEGHLDPYKNGAADDLTRGFLRKNFWVMETQPGFVNWAPVNTPLDKGEVRAMAWHNIGHGADAVEYWQWRSALNGQEELHGTLVGADGTPVPVYSEAQQLGAEFAKAGPVLAGTSVHSEVAILHSYDSRWAINWQRHNKNFDPVTQIVSYYKPLREVAQSVDIVQPTVDLSQYKLVVAPGLEVITEAAAKNLIAYVQNGGHLVLGQRTGMKNDDNGLWPQREPGPLAELLGGRVDQFYAIDDKPGDTVPVTGTWGDTTAKIWAEQLSVSSPDTKVLMRYGKSNGWLDGQPAAITRQVGKGSITYIGAWMDDAAMLNAAKWMVETSGVTPAFGPVPDGVDVYPREGEGKKVFILVNFNKDPQTVTLPSTMHAVLSGKDESSITLDQYGVAVLEAK
ncbi:beta-galactosidase [Edaphobacter acidisoli]|uniref:Beta-galactosidase n=1 Tax=Edaphobacter acidisoli TaxID=2040573 RepID=A0A916RMR2_9BACT|nr:beta-galactosidase [Edaphobacter acidisoli]GGA61958.1 beta-galactosidase [Edaphobacter acidisoli]